METDEFEPFRGLPLTREQDAEIREYVDGCMARNGPWDTLRFSYMLKGMLNPRPPEDDAEHDEGEIDGR